MLYENVDVLLTVVRTKLDASFPSARCSLTYIIVYRLDISHKTGGLLIHVEAAVPDHKFSLPSF